MQNKYNNYYIGKKVQVLFEEKEGEYYKGYTTNYIKIHVKSNEYLENKIKIVKIYKIEKDKIIGSITNEE